MVIIQPEFLLVFFIIFICGIIQSLLGIGLLIFGTPTLLLLGYDYVYVLIIILPCSILISFLQIFKKKDFVFGKKYLYFYTIPTLSIGVFLIIDNKLDINVIKYIGAILFCIGVIRVNKKLNLFFKKLVTKFTVPYCLFIGLIHGLFNMSGAFLTVFMSSVNDSAEKIRVSIAYWYLVFAIIQIFILFITSALIYSKMTLVFLVISLISYVLVFFTLSKMVNLEIYQRIVTIVIFLYSLSCFVL